MKTLGVSEYVKNMLDALKDRNGHTSMDSLMRYFLALEKGMPCKGEKCTWYWNCVEYGCQTFKEKTEESPE